MVLYFCGLSKTGISLTIMEFLRPLLLVTVCSDFDDDLRVVNYVRFIDIEGNALVHEVRMTYQQGQDFEVTNAVQIVGRHAIQILERQSLACVFDMPGVLTDSGASDFLLSLALFDMQTGELRQVHQFEPGCPFLFLAHVPREGLIVLGRESSLSLFDEETLALAGSIPLAGPDDYYLRSILGGFTHDSLASCVVVGGVLGGLDIVNVEQRTITGTISLPRLPVNAWAGINALENLTLAASGWQVAVTRHTHLYVVDLRPNEHPYQHHLLGHLPRSVVFVGDSRLAYSSLGHLIILDISSGELLHQFHLRNAYFPTHCVKSPNSDWVVVALTEDEDQHDGCLYKVQIEAPFMVELICEDLVKSLFFQ